mmetsp:Transcript_1860/g.4329  ORF Transcript_1860/g.4329 Transcript_1860/m.4329 type:complete len:210 (+) Transcript_1860:89-718(+)
MSSSVSSSLNASSNSFSYARSSAKTSRSSNNVSARDLLPKFLNASSLNTDMRLPSRKFMLSGPICSRNELPFRGLGSAESSPAASLIPLSDGVDRASYLSSTSLPLRPVAERGASLKYSLSDPLFVPSTSTSISSTGSSSSSESTSSSSDTSGSSTTIGCGNCSTTLAAAAAEAYSAFPPLTLIYLALSLPSRKFSRQCSLSAGLRASQ